jgi:para-nitrobenzyl esterase
VAHSLGEDLLDYQPASARAKAGTKSLKDWRAMPTATLEAAKTRGMVGFGPDIDGRLLVEPVQETYAAGRQAHLPLLAGWNRDEGNFFVMGGMTAEKFKARAAGMFKERAAEFLKLFSADNDEQATRSAIDFGSDQFIALGTWSG